MLAGGGIALALGGVALAVRFGRPAAFYLVPPGLVLGAVGVYGFLWFRHRAGTLLDDAIRDDFL